MLCIVVCLHAHAPYACSTCGGQRREASSPGAGVTEGYEQPCGLREPNPGPLQEQPVPSPLSHLSSPSNELLNQDLGTAEMLGG